MNEQCNDDRLSSHEGREYEPSENFDDACAASVLASADSNNGTSSLSEVRHRRFPISPPGTVPLQRETRDENKTIDLNASNKAVGEKTTNEGRQEMVSPPSIPAFAVLWVSLIGACLYCMSLLLVGFGQLAFLAIAPWAWLTLDARSIRCSGVLILWLVGVFTWIVLEQGQALTWPVDSGANVLLLLVLGLFLPCFVLMGRWFRSLFHLPAYLTLPIAWCATEYIRSTCLSGLSIGLLAHAAAESRRIIQVIDLFGSYGLGMLMVASGSSLAEIVWVSRRLRGLESTQAHSSNASSGDVKRRGGSFHSLGFGTRQGRHSAQKSMLAVLRRKRDHARDVYLVSGVFSLFLLVGILVFANVYGKERAEESKAWRMFESHLYEVAVFSGESDS